MSERLHYTAFDSHDELTSCLKSIQRLVSPSQWEHLSNLFEHQPHKFWEAIPLHIKHTLRQSLEANLYTYIGEMVEKLEGLYTFTYQIKPTQTGHIIAPHNDKDQRDILDIYLHSPLHRPHESPSPETIARRRKRRADEIWGLRHARKQMLAMHPNDLLFWTSPPGDPKDGYPGHSFIFIAQKRPNHSHIDIFSTTINLDPHSLIALINHFKPNSLPSSANVSEILSQAVLIKASQGAIPIDQIFHSLNALTPSFISPPSTIDLQTALDSYRQFVDFWIDSFFSGANANHLQSLIRSFNHSHRKQIESGSGNSSSCGQADFGPEPNMLPSQHPNDNLKSQEFLCPACNQSTDPCLGICTHCQATPFNWREIKKTLDATPISPPIIPLPPTYHLSPPLIHSPLPKTPPPPFFDLPIHHPPLLVLIGLSVLKLYPGTKAHQIYLDHYLTQN